MKSSINDKGEITVKPENTTEEYALARWTKENKGEYDKKVNVKTFIKNNRVGFRRD